MSPKPRQRLSTDAALKSGAQVDLPENQAHYLGHVLRLKAGDRIALFNRTEGEWLADITEVKKKSMTLQVGEQLRPAATPVDLWVAFAPIKGGRLETIIEKATELGAAELHPVITQRTIVDKVNVDRADNIAREAAEQCERTDWPSTHAPVKLANFLGSFPKDRVLIYGDETGQGEPITSLLKNLPLEGGGGRDVSAEALAKAEAAGGGAALRPHSNAAPPSQPSPLEGEGVKWAILAGPEGGFTPDELAMLRHLPNARAVSLGPRILRADTAIITLAAITLAAWGDWDRAPRFQGESA